MSSGVEGVPDDVVLYRLLNPEHDITWDENDRQWIIKSSAFQNTSRTDRMSIVLGDTLEASGRPPEDARRSKPTWYVAAITTRLVRNEEQDVQRTPRPEEEAHGDVIGDKGKARRRRFVAAAWWIVSPPQIR